VGLPGAGHVYAGEPAKGVSIFFVSAVPVGLGAALSGCSKSYSPDRCYYTPLYLGLGVHAANWIWSILDADDAVRRHNRRVGRHRRADVKAGPAVGRHGKQLAYGVRVTVAL
jgi:hypothetical protein